MLDPLQAFQRVAKHGRASDPASGVRDLEAVQALAAQAGLSFLADIEMPANNRCLVWQSAS